MHAFTVVLSMLAAGYAGGPGLAPPGLDQVAFLQGCWRGPIGSAEGDYVEERWGPPSGDLMLGTVVYVRAGRPTQHEFIEIRRGKMVVTAVRIDGFYLTDLCPIVGKMGAAPDADCTAEDLAQPAGEGFHERSRPGPFPNERPVRYADPERRQREHLVVEPLRENALDDLNEPKDGGKRRRVVERDVHSFLLRLRLEGKTSESH